MANEDARARHGNSMMAHMLGNVSRRLLIALAVVVAACAPSTTRLSGTELERSDAPDFTLTDGVSGRSLTLSALRGNVVVMAFLYTHCPDVCPLTASQFRAAQKSLGADAQRVRFVAVSVDPTGDTPTAVQSFSAAHDLSANWYYLIGPRAQLQPVWSLYGVGAFDGPTGMSVDHNDAIYVLDAKGKEREIVHSDVALKDLVADLRALLAER
jgi:protein SCO1